jgi:predicted aspartyl protease
MSAGWFDVEGQLRFEIELVDKFGVSLAVDALLDTGSTEWLVLSTQDIEILGWSFVGRRTLKTVQGEMNLKVYTGKVIFDGHEFDIPAVASPFIEDYLIGLPWLLERRLVVDMKAGILTLADAEQ